MKFVRISLVTNLLTTNLLAQDKNCKFSMKLFSRKHKSFACHSIVRKNKYASLRLREYIQTPTQRTIADKSLGTHYNAHSMKPITALMMSSHKHTHAHRRHTHPNLRKD